MPRPFLATVLLAALTGIAAFSVTGCRQAQPPRPAGHFTPAASSYPNPQPSAYQGSPSPGGSGTRPTPNSGGSGTR